MMVSLTLIQNIKGRGLKNVAAATALSAMVATSAALAAGPALPAGGRAVDSPASASAH
jgi:hypothetical protein